MQYLSPLVVCIVFIIVEKIYISLAHRFKIHDHPSERGSHSESTVRGGGIVFPLAWLLYWILNGRPLGLLTFGVMLVAGVSAIDDLKGISRRLRFSIHVIAVLLSFVEFHTFETLGLPLGCLAILVCLAHINFVNFMDGINGMLVASSIVFWSATALIYNDQNWNALLDPTQPYMFVVSALLAFLIFNFRKKAACFAGDIGSISMGYLMASLGVATIGIGAKDTLHLSSHPDLFINLFFFLCSTSVLWADAFTTVLMRLLSGENIFKPHRKHFYQFLANERRMPHLGIASLYALVQLLISTWAFASRSSLKSLCLISLVPFTLIIILRKLMVQKTHLGRV